MKDSAAGRSAQEPDSHERLDGWKEIASYLQRDVRTVRRWEKQEGLPIRRHLHEKRASVYAYRGELTEWWNNRGDQLDQIGAASGSQLRRNLPRIVGILALLVVALLTWWAQNSWLDKPIRALEFDERDWVLIADFDNQTGESLFDGTLEYALARELSNSPYINVVPRRRVDDVLQLMKLSPDTRVDERLAREICLRDGAIKAFLTGKVEKLGSTFVIGAALAAGGDGQIIASHTESVQDPKLFWPAIRGLSQWARTSLGETLPLIRQETAKLEEVTTPSLKALQLFSKGDVLHHRGMYKPAAELYQQALVEDPNFAVAHMWLAFVLKILGHPEGEWLLHVEKAVELCENLSEAERYIILGKSHYIRGEYEKAIPYYEALLEIDPDHLWGLQTLRVLYLLTGKTEQAANSVVHAASVRPNDFYTHLSAVRILSVARGISEAVPYALRARDLITDEIRRQHAFLCSWIRLVPALAYWSQGDYERALSEIEKPVERFGELDQGTKGTLGEHCSYLLLALGKLGEAKELAERLPRRYRERVIANLSLFTDDYGLMDRFAKRVDATNSRPDLIIALARAGYPSEAEEAMFSRWVEIRRNPSSDLPLEKARLGIMEAEVALARGAEAEAIDLLRENLQLYETFSATEPRVIYFFGCESLARLLEQRGDIKGALRVMKHGSRAEWRNYFPVGPFPWIKQQWLLAGLYRRLGEHETAREIEVELLTLLVLSDSDHPMLLELKAREEAELTFARPQQIPH